HPARGPGSADARLPCRGADGDYLVLAPGREDQDLPRRAQDCHPDGYRLIAEILLAGCGKGGCLSALGPDHGVGYSGGARHPERRRRADAQARRVALHLWQWGRWLQEWAVRGVGRRAGLAFRPSLVQDVASTLLTSLSNDRHPARP